MGTNSPERRFFRWSRSVFGKTSVVLLVGWVVRGAYLLSSFLASPRLRCLGGGTFLRWVLRPYLLLLTVLSAFPACIPISCGRLYGCSGHPLGFSCPHSPDAFLCFAAGFSSCGCTSGCVGRICTRWDTIGGAALVLFGIQAALLPCNSQRIAMEQERGCIEYLYIW